MQRKKGVKNYWTVLKCVTSIPRALARSTHVIPQNCIGPRSWVVMYKLPMILGFPCSSVNKESDCNAGDLGSIPGLGRSPG